jgi:hypothetical protein
MNWSEEECIRLLVGKPEGKRPWVDKIKIDLGKKDLGGVDWIGLAQNREK